MATFNCILNDVQFYNYSHRRNISGTLTLTNSETFDSFEIYLNNVKLPSPNIAILNNEITFAMEIFIQSGLNTIKVIANYIKNGNKYNIKEESTYNLDYVEDEKEKEYLLYNFIGNDFEKTQLSIGNAELSYKDNSAKNNKELNIDTEIASKFFKLLGDEAKYYRLDREQIPKILSNIIPRPLFVTFDNVEKMYDGNNDATQLLLDLIGHNNNNKWIYNFQKNHNFKDINNDQYDYANCGFLEGISETLINKTIIYKANDEVKLDDEIEIVNNDVDFNDFEISIDGVIGNYNGNKFIFVNPGQNSENYIIYQSIQSTFDEITLIQKEITNENDEVIDLKYFVHFTLNDETTPYKVLDSIIIKYKYKNNNENKQIYCKSDVDYVSLDFSSAKFDTRNVTTGNQPILINELNFKKGIEQEDRSKNYQIAGYNFNGIIRKRPVNVNVNCLSKIYDGNCIVPIEVTNNSVYENGVSKKDGNSFGKIENDSLYITCANNSNVKDDNTHYDLSLGNTYCTYLTPDVGDNKEINIYNSILEGNDKENYYLDNKYINTSDARILPREIQLIINKVIINSKTNEFVIDYSFINDISSDNLSINFGNIKIYSGREYGTNNDIDYTNTTPNTPDVFDLFFNYTPLSQDEWIETTDEYSNVYDVTIQNTKTLWYEDDSRVAINKNLTRKVMTRKLNNGLYFENVGNVESFYESKNKEYQLYAGCEVTIKNVYLDDSNEKSNNYILNEHNYKSVIEII